MKLFEMVGTWIVIGVLSFISEVINGTLLYAIFVHSPSSMGRYKRMLWKMGVTDMLFSISISWLHMPNLLFPIPAAITQGLMRYFGPMGGRIANTLSFATCAATLLSVNDCCLYRFFVFFRMDSVLEKFTAVPGFLLCIFAHIAITAVVGVFSIFFTSDYYELLEYAKRHNVTNLMASLTPETSMIALDVDTPSMICFAVVISLYIFATEGANIGLSLAVRRKISQSRRSMSKETFRMQKSLTRVLLAQTIIPGVSVTTPVMIYLFALFFDKYEYVDLIGVQMLVIIAIGGYPMINSFFCFFFMKPYRDFLVRLKNRILCRKTSTSSVTVISEPSGFSSSSAFTA